MPRRPEERARDRLRSLTGATGRAAGQPTPGPAHDQALGGRPSGEPELPHVRPHVPPWVPARDSAARQTPTGEPRRSSGAARLDAAAPTVPDPPSGRSPDVHAVEAPVSAGALPPRPREPAGSVTLASPGQVPAQVDRDAADVAARSGSGLRSVALADAARAYRTRYGDPLDPALREEDGRSGKSWGRWAVPVRLALGAALVLAVVAGGVALRALVLPEARAPAVVLPEVGGVHPLATATAGEAAGQGGQAAAPGVGDATGGAAPGTGTVVVHVVGEVLTPGVVELPGGSRVDDAIGAAGGAAPSADLASLNLARVLVDGEQVVVPSPGQALAGDGAQPLAETGGADDRLDLNTADVAAFDELPGIGPVLAGRIVEWRSEHGRFSDVEELGEVAGIGPTLLGRLRALVSL